MINFVLQNGWSPLMVASDQRHVEVVTMLINAGADVDQTNEVSGLIWLIAMKSNPSSL